MPLPQESQCEGPAAGGSPQTRPGMVMDSVLPASEQLAESTPDENPCSTIKAGMGEQIVTNLGQVKVSPRDQQVLNLLVQGCSNKEIGDQLNISPSTVKQHLRMLFVRAGIFDGRKRVKLARSVHEGDSAVMTACAGLNLMESQISILVWEGLTNREIGKIVGTSEQMIKNHLRSAFDKLGVWSRLELAMYMTSGGGKGRLPETSRPNSPGTIGHDRSIYTNS
jgi:DNA-binding NarL/FixJ family response regulator